MANLAISLNADTGIRFPAALGSHEGPLTICGWYKFNAEPGQTFSVLQHLTTFASIYTAPYLQFYSGDGGAAVRQLWWDNGQVFRNYESAPAVGTWFYGAQMFRKIAPDDYHHRLWVDGVEAAALANVNVALPPSIDCLITGDPTFVAPFDGSVAAVKIFQRLLTSEEMLAESTQRAPILADDCLAAWGCRGVLDLAQLVGAGPATFFHENPLSPVPAVDVAGPAALDGDEPVDPTEILLADLPDTVEVINLLDEALLISGGVRFSAGQTRILQLKGLGAGAKSDLWLAIYDAEQRSLVDAGGLPELLDPASSGHSYTRGQSLTGGQTALRTVTPE